MRIKLSPLLLTLFFLTLSACTQPKEESAPLPAPVQTLKQQGMQIVGDFDSPSGLHTYAGIMGQQAIGIYVLDSDQYAIVGTMVDSNGNRVSQNVLENFAAQNREDFAGQDREELAGQDRSAVPDIQLSRLDGTTVLLSQLANNQPIVVNLWASWCPPCREEMPMLEAAQQRYPGLTFAFVNQREGRETIRNFLDNMQLQLSHVLLDQGGSVLQSLDSNALPTTLFFDTNKELVGQHRGMLTAASLNATLERLNLVSGQVADNTRREDNE